GRGPSCWPMTPASAVPDLPLPGIWSYPRPACAWVDPPQGTHTLAGSGRGQPLPAYPLRNLTGPGQVLEGELGQGREAVTALRGLVRVELLEGGRVRAQVRGGLPGGQR